MIVLSIKGCILEAFKTNHYDALVHGCNCFCNMGAGLAKSISKSYASVLKADQTTLVGDKSKLGSYTIAKTKNGDVINAYTQFRYGGGKMNVDYDAIRQVFEKLNKQYAGKVICIPKIGAGLAKGDWKLIKKIINESTPDVEIALYYI